MSVDLIFFGISDLFLVEAEFVSFFAVVSTLYNTKTF